MDMIWKLWGVFLLMLAFTAFFAFLVAGWMMVLKWVIVEYGIFQTIRRQRKARRKSDDLFLKVEDFQNDFKQSDSKS